MSDESLVGPTLFINGEPAGPETNRNSQIGKVSDAQAELDSLMNATDASGNLRFTVDPQYRESIQERSKALITAINYEQGYEAPKDDERIYDDRDPMTKVLDNEDMVDFLEAKDRYGRQRMAVDPDFRQSVYDYFLRKYPDMAADHNEVIG
jgi:dsDNA-specific endonuclease/ATPase MutS2